MPRVVVFGSLLLAALVGCSASGGEREQASRDDAPEGTKLARSKLAREMSPAVSDAELSQLGADNRHFALDLYAQLKSGSDNLFFSPYSISVALGMTYAGARGATKSELAQVLRFSLPEPQLHAAFNGVDLALSKRASERDEGEKAGDGFRLSPTNALFVQDGLKLVPDFLDSLSTHYGSGMYVADFAKDHERERAAINEWVSLRTEQRIDELLPPSALDPRVVLVLVNAIYFKASWLTKFMPENSQPAPFHTPAGDVTVQMMRGRGESYARLDGYQVLRLPYVSRSVGAIFILPDEGQFEAVESRLSSGLFDEAVSGLKEQTVEVALPRFQFKTEYTLSSALRSLGLQTAFDHGAADFSGIFEQPSGVAIKEIYHDAFVAMDERGTEAAAATAVVFSRKSATLTPQFTADRPFIFFIHDQPTGQILFAGRVMRPVE